MNATAIASPTADEKAPSLLDLLQDGMHVLALMRHGGTVVHVSAFRREVEQLLTDFERHARNFGKDPLAVDHCKFAFCALLDELAMGAGADVRDEWEREPLQLKHFGEHLAGESFFQRLEQLRYNPERHIETLECFHRCLLLGFRGRYLLEGSERLDYLIAQIGREIASVRGAAPSFAPHASLPMRITDAVKTVMPVWLFALILATVVVLSFTAMAVVLRVEANSWLLPQGSDHHAGAER
jgi:type VI secretion system protein ImpK